VRLEKQLSKPILDVRTIVEEIPHMGGATLNTKKVPLGLQIWVFVGGYHTNHIAITLVMSPV
jgi:hypothetical protein